MGGLEDAMFRAALAQENFAFSFKYLSVNNT
jgi:hypothetical protein